MAAKPMDVDLTQVKSLDEIIAERQQQGQEQRQRSHSPRPRSRSRSRDRSRSRSRSRAQKGQDQRRRQQHGGSSGQRRQYGSGGGQPRPDSWHYRKGRSMSSTTCHYCRKLGHIRTYCRRRMDDERQGIFRSYLPATPPPSPPASRCYSNPELRYLSERLQNAGMAVVAEHAEAVVQQSARALGRMYQSGLTATANVQDGLNQHMGWLIAGAAQLGSSAFQPPLGVPQAPVVQQQQQPASSLHLAPIRTPSSSLPANAVPGREERRLASVVTRREPGSPGRWQEVPTSGAKTDRVWDEVERGQR